MKSVTAHHEIVKGQTNITDPGFITGPGANTQKSQFASSHPHQLMLSQSTDFYDPVSIISTAAVFLHAGEQ